MTPCNQFNIRVYGLLFNEHKQVLVTDEFRIGRYMTKFPGGGLEFGEGTIDCLKREFREELDLDIAVDKHFYTTDYFQAAISFENMQLISIYYIVNTQSTKEIVTSNEVNDIPMEDGAQSFRWVSIKEIHTDDFTFPIDKKVAKLIKTTL